MRTRKKIIPVTKWKMRVIILSLILLFGISTPCITKQLENQEIQIIELPEGNRKTITFHKLKNEVDAADVFSYTPSDLPNGYIIAEKMTTSRANMILYKSNKDTITYLQLASSSAVNIDINFEKIKEIEKDNITYYLMKKNNSSENLLIWTDGGYQYLLFSTCLPKKLMEIALSIQ